MRPGNESLQERLERMKEEYKWRLVALTQLGLQVRSARLEYENCLLEEDISQLTGLVAELFRVDSLDMEEILIDKLFLSPEEVQEYRIRYGWGDGDEDEDEGEGEDEDEDEDESETGQGQGQGQG